jgi:hypothetical protein
MQYVGSECKHVVVDMFCCSGYAGGAFLLLLIFRGGVLSVQRGVGRVGLLVVR